MAQPLLLLLVAGLAHARCSFDRCTNTRGGNKGTVDDSGRHACWARANPTDFSTLHKCTCMEGTAFLTGNTETECGQGHHDPQCNTEMQYTCCDEDEVPTNAPLCNVHHPQACRANGVYDDDCCARKTTSSCAEGFTKVQSNNDCGPVTVSYTHLTLPTKA